MIGHVIISWPACFAMFKEQNCIVSTATQSKHKICMDLSGNQTNPLIISFDNNLVIQIGVLLKRRLADMSSTMLWGWRRVMSSLLWLLL